MKKLGFAIGAAVLGLVTAAGAQAAPIGLEQGDSYYVGYYAPPEPASEGEEAGYINFLIDVSAGDTGTDSSDGNRFYSRVGSTVEVDLLPDAIAATAFKVEAEINGDPNPEFDANNIDTLGWTYLIAKYDGPNGGSMVWYLAGTVESVSVPAKWGPSTTSYDISHYTLFNPTSVPDGGATLALLGCALVGLGVIRRSLSS